MYIKNLKKKYQEKWENAYLIVKNARASKKQLVSKQAVFFTIEKYSSFAN